MNIKLKQDEKIRIFSSTDIYPIMQRILLRESASDRKKEHFWTIALDSGHRILSIELVSMGTVYTVPIEPMEVYSIPLQKKAVKIIIVHNHPSGLLTPSKGDKDKTDQLIQVGLIMHVPVVDHIIISEESYYSFLDNGLMAELEKSSKYVPAFILKERYEKAGKEIGKELGIKENQKEMARKMRAEGIDIDTIAKITGLSKASIVKIKDK